MRSLLALKQVLLEEDVTGIKAFFNEIDPQTCNERMQLLCKHLGLTNLEIHGICYAHLGRTSEVFGYADISGLRKLVERYQIWCPKIGSFGLEVQKIIRETFTLDPKDGQATFISFHGMLLAGMKGETAGAEKVQLYLVKCENTLWEAIKTLDQFKLEMYRLKRIEKIITLADKLANMPDSPYKDEAIGAFECLTGKTFPKSRQLRLPGI